MDSQPPTPPPPAIQTAAKPAEPLSFPNPSNSLSVAGSVVYSPDRVPTIEVPAEMMADAMLEQMIANSPPPAPPHLEEFETINRIRALQERAAASKKPTGPSRITIASSLQKTLSGLRSAVSAVKAADQQKTVDRLKAERHAERFMFKFARDTHPLCGTQPPILHRTWLIANDPITAGDWPDEKAVTRLLVSLTHGSTCALLGKRGTGKTQLAAWICREWPDGTGYFRACDVFSMVKSWYGVDGGRHVEWNKRELVRVPLLVIDEIHESLGTDHDDKLLTELIDKRYGERRSTLLISNLVPEEFVKRVGPSIASRITEGGTTEVFAGTGFRGRKAA